MPKSPPAVNRLPASKKSAQESYAVAALLWTILTVVLAVVVLLLILAGPTFAGRKSAGDVEETTTRLWSGLWNKDDADRLN